MILNPDFIKKVDLTGSGDSFSTLTGWGWFDRNVLGQQGEDNNARAINDLNEMRGFVGSFSITISEANKNPRTTVFTAKNETGLWSAAFLALPNREFNSSPIGNLGGYRDNWRPSFATVRQTFQWTEINPCNCR